MRTIKYIIIAILAFSVISCTDFLDVNPDKSGNASIYHMDQLNALLSKSDMYRSGQYTWIESVFASDDCEITPHFYLRGGIGDLPYGVSNWNRTDYEQPSVEACSWQCSYKNMFVFNTILEYLDKVEQTTTTDKEMIRGEALFGRAYAHFFALVAFTRYDSNAPGIGYKTSTNPLDIPARMTVAYTMDKIAEDIKNAEAALTAAGRTTFELKRNFRVTLPTLYAFKARFELYKGNYEVALDAANKALAGHSTLLDFKNDPLYEIKNPSNTDILDANGNKTGKKLEYYEMTKLLNEGQRAVAEYSEFYLPHVTDVYFANRVIPISKSLYNLFDRENDERWKRFYNNNYDIVKVGAISKAGFTYEDQQKLEPWEYHTYHRFVNSSGSSGKYYILGPTTAEMMLIKAECLARAGKTGDAQIVLQKLRTTRFTTVETANKIGGSVQDVLDERRREMTSVFRWYDIKRLNGKENANISITKRRYSVLTDLQSPIITSTLAPNDPFYAWPLSPTQITLMGWENN